MDERLTYWELGEVLKKTAEAFQRLPKATFTEIEIAEKEMLVSLKTEVESVMAQAGDVQKAIDAKGLELCEQCDAVYAKVREHRNSIAEKLKDINAPIRIDVPYGLKDLCDIAQRFQHLDDVAWGRVVELAKALGRKEGEE